MTKKLSINQRLTRKPISRACEFCHVKHLQCDPGRPCQNCLKRDIPHQCKNKLQRSKRRDLILNESTIIVNSSNGTVQSGDGYSREPSLEIATAPLSYSTNELTIDNLVKVQSLNNILGNFNLFLGQHFSNPEVKNDINVNEDIHKQLDNMISPLTSKTVSNSNSNFDSVWANAEYKTLDKIVGKQDPSNLKLSSGANIALGSVARTTRPPNISLRPHISLDVISTSIPFEEPHSALSESISEYDQVGIPRNKRNGAEYTTPYKFRKLVRNSKELYQKRDVINPHNYKQAYIELLDFLNIMFSSKSSKTPEVSILRAKQLQYIIRSVLNRYASSFISLTTNLIEDDLIYQEIILQRTLLELENMSKLVNSTPIVIWRRTGEICYISNEFVSLTGFSRKEILNYRSFIIQFMDHKSVVNYYETFHNRLSFSINNINSKFSESENSAFTKLNILLNNGSFLKCACCLSVVKDTFKVPLLITGHFMPIFDIP